jgi:hypothetical protein
VTLKKMLNFCQVLVIVKGCLIALFRFKRFLERERERQTDRQTDRQSERVKV